MAAGCFGVVYAFFVACLVSLGIFLSPIIRVPLHLLIRTVNRFSNRKRPPAYDLAPFDWATFLFVIFAVIMIVGLGRQDHSAYWNLPLLSIGLYFFYSIFHSSGKKLRNIMSVQNAVLHTEDKEKIAGLGNPEHLRRSQWISIAAVLVMPLFLGHVSGQLLDAAMRFGKIRIEHPTIYVKTPYALMLPKDLISKDHGSLADYTRFETDSERIQSCPSRMDARPERSRFRTIRSSLNNLKYAGCQRNQWPGIGLACMRT